MKAAHKGWVPGTVVGGAGEMLVKVRRLAMQGDELLVVTLTPINNTAWYSYLLRVGYSRSQKVTVTTGGDKYAH